MSDPFSYDHSCSFFFGCICTHKCELIRVYDMTLSYTITMSKTLIFQFSLNLEFQNFKGRQD